VKTPPSSNGRARAANGRARAANGRAQAANGRAGFTNCRARGAENVIRIRRVHLCETIYRPSTANRQSQNSLFHQ
jgi:hypothetical protein